MGLEQVTVASHPVSRMDMGEYLKYLEIHKAQDEWTRSWLQRPYICPGKKEGLVGFSEWPLTSYIVHNTVKFLTHIPTSNKFGKLMLSAHVFSIGHS